MKQQLTCLILFIFAGLTPSFAQGTESIEIGTTHSLYSDILGEERSYWVSLPASYDGKYNSYKKYPVIYLLDGHIHFASVTGMTQFMSRASNGSRKVPEMIIVGVMNVDRQRDFTPDKIITRRENNTGGGKKFLSFLEEELVPVIDENFRTEPFRILFGHSLGGLLTSHAYIQDTSAFNAFIAVDPSFGTWDNVVMDEKLETLSDKIFDRPFYIATANWEKRNLRNRDRHIRFFESLNSKCPGPFKAQLDYFEDETHSTVSLPAFYEAMTYLFEGYNLSYRNVQDIDQLNAVYDKLSARLSYDFKAPEELINRIAYGKLRSSREEVQQQAVEFFELNTRYYPGSFNVFDSLGEALFRTGDLEAAAMNFEKSLSLNPENENATKMLAKITDSK